MKNINVDGKGIYDFKKIIDTNTFYIDKTYFIKEWCSNTDEVTLITRPRRFGKTLNLSMMEYFFSNEHKEDRYLFNGLYIEECKDIMAMQGEYPVINISFAEIDESDVDSAIGAVCKTIQEIYENYIYLLDSDCISDTEKKYYKRILDGSADRIDYKRALKRLSLFLEKQTKKKTMIFLDEYDTPMQTAYVGGYWDEFAGFIKGLLRSTFKENRSLERGIMTGITRVAKENIFSGLNNLSVITTTSSKYASCFGFTEEEVKMALDIYGLSKEFDKVKEYYDGFIFGNDKNDKNDDKENDKENGTNKDNKKSKYEIYNPWSIVSFLQNKEYLPYWANTSSNSLISDVLIRADEEVKKQFEQLLKGDTIRITMSEDISFNELDEDSGTIWGLMVCSGYLKVCDMYELEDDDEALYDLQITNKETTQLLRRMVKRWFKKKEKYYNEFTLYMLKGNDKKMEKCLNRLALDMFSYFDAGKKPSEYTEPERFYHGFVLGLLVDLKGRFEVLSNRESGLGRYDIMLKPLDVNKDVGVIIEFKVFDKCDEELTLDDTLDNALAQIEEMKYESTLISANVKTIYKYGIAFLGKVCKIRKAV